MRHDPQCSQLLLILLAVWFASSAHARTMQQKLQAACTADAAKLCQSTVSDPDLWKACLMAKRTEVSAECMKLVDASE